MAATDTLTAVQTALINASVGQKTSSSTAWMIYRGYMQDVGGASPSDADKAICLYETPGQPPLEAWQIDYPGVQVKVRGTEDGYTDLRIKIQEVFDALHAKEAAIGSAFVYFYGIGSAPLQMGLDEKRRPSMIWNFRCMRTRVTA